MRFQTPLVPARLIRRYKRFLADCRLEDGREVTAHCPNPGAMPGLAEPGQQIWLEPNADPRRKLDFGWRLVDHENGHFTCVDTGLANRVVDEALRRKAIAPLAGHGTIRAEVAFGDRSRADFRLQEPGLAATWVEVKSVTLSRKPGLAEFPDCVTARGTKHLGELARAAAGGERAVLLYLVMRSDAARFAIADDIDPAYGAAARAAAIAGVETLVFGTSISPAGIDLTAPLVSRVETG
ncbi:DNA/RNA nuclease SfsA [Pontibaca methylaminivorans]|uniref:DNA/RNA nuclease SfsA n=1 Tax=Pontibaca methylaminivorans TaxID=515897 RepID=UPI002FD8A389